MKGSPGLKSHRRKNKEYIDYDYLHKLSPAELKFLDQFSEEYYEANGYKYAHPMLDKKAMGNLNNQRRRDILNSPIHDRVFWDDQK
jgi:hypothetical protein